MRSTQIEHLSGFPIARRIVSVCWVASPFSRSGVFRFRLCDLVYVVHVYWFMCFAYWVSEFGEGGRGEGGRREGGSVGLFYNIGT